MAQGSLDGEAPKLLIEEFKNAADAYRYLETSRLRYVTAAATATGAALALALTQVADHRLWKPEAIPVVLTICVALTLFCFLLRQGYVHLGSVLTHHHNVLNYVRQQFYGDNAIEMLKQIDPYNNPEIQSRGKLQKISTLSSLILTTVTLFWFVASLLAAGRLYYVTLC